MSDTPPIKTLSSQITWSSPYYHIHTDQIEYPDGRTGIYHVLELADSVFIVPVLEDGRIVLIRNYRYTLGQWVWEVPAGGIKAGQSALEAAQMELAEEVGGTAQAWRFLCKASAMNGIGHHHAHFFLATGVQLGDTHHEATEIMEVVLMEKEAVYQLVHGGQMNDAISMTALLLAQRYLD